MTCGPAKSSPEISYREAGALVAATHPQTNMYMYTHLTMISAHYSHCYHKKYLKNRTYQVMYTISSLQHDLVRRNISILSAFGNTKLSDDR